MKRRQINHALAATLVAGTLPTRGVAREADGRKVLRYAFPVAETGFDPARVSDQYSRIVTSHVFEAPYRFDYLARPVKMVPNTAAAMPQSADDFKTWTIRIQPGIFFADDPAFKGVPRELTAADYVYAWKRFFDPVTKSPAYSSIAQEGIVGLDALRQEAIASKRPFDYDRPVEGLAAIDRYTIRCKLENPRPRFVSNLLTDNSLYGALAREVVAFYGDDHIAEHPVGTGPFRLIDWRRSSFLGLDRNPAYRDVRYDAEPADDDVAGQAMLRRFKGRRLPMIDRVEVSIIEEGQPRWLSFLNGEFDVIAVPFDFANQAIPGGKLAPWLARRAVQMDRFVSPDRYLYYFNMDDPVVGGMAPEKVALRRAMALGNDVEKQIRVVWRGQAIPAQGPIAPGGYGYEADFVSLNSEYSPARAKALLDLYGYVDRDGDGWREQPDGKPMVLEYGTTPDGLSRQFDELFKKDMDAIGVRLVLKTAKWPEQLKAARAAKLMMWQLSYTDDVPDCQSILEIIYGPASGGQNLSRFNDPRFNDLYRRMQALPDGPERLALLREAVAISIAYMPQHCQVHRILTYLMQPRLLGFRKPPYSNEFWAYVDIDERASAVRT